MDNVFLLIYSFCLYHQNQLNYKQISEGSENGEKTSVLKGLRSIKKACWHLKHCFNYLGFCSASIINSKVIILLINAIKTNQFLDFANGMVYLGLDDQIFTLHKKKNSCHLRKDTLCILVEYQIQLRAKQTAHLVNTIKMRLL